MGETTTLREDVRGMRNRVRKLREGVAENGRRIRHDRDSAYMMAAVLHILSEIEGGLTDILERDDG